MLSEKGSRWISLYGRFHSYFFTIPFAQDAETGSIKIGSWILVTVSKTLSLTSLFHFLYSICQIVQHFSNPPINIYNLYISIYIFCATAFDLSVMDSIFSATPEIVKIVKNLSYLSNKCKGNSIFNEYIEDNHFVI